MALSPELPVPKDLWERVESLFTFDCIRISRILETAQYAVIFGILALFAGWGIDQMVKSLYPQPNGVRGKCKTFTYRQSWRVVGVILFQVMCSAVLAIYIRKLGDVVPFFFGSCSGRYIPHWKVKEVEGEIAIALVYVGIQTNLIEALATLRQSFGTTDCEKRKE